MNRPDSLKQRVEFLEREIATLKELRREQIPGVYDTAPSPRLARTIDDGSYPTAPAKTYPICFLDGSFPATAGNITPSFTQHSQNCQAIAYAVSDGSYLPPGSLGHAWRQNGRYWFSPIVESSDAMAVVRVNGSVGIPTCGDTSPNAECVWDGKLVGMGIGSGSLCGEIWTDIGDCYIKPVNACSAPASLKNGERFLARKVGQHTILGDTRDLYQVQSAHGTSGGHVVTMLTSPRWWIDNGGSAGTEDTTTGGYLWHPSPHNRSFRMAFNSMLFNGAGITHNPASYGTSSGNITITIPGTYIFTMYVQLIGWANTAGAASPPSPAESHLFQVVLQGSLGTEILGHESFSTDDPYLEYGLAVSPSMGTLFQQKTTTAVFSTTKTVTTGVIRFTARRANDTPDNVTFVAQEFGVVVYNAQLRIERLS